MSYAAIDNPYPTLTSAVGIAINNGLVYIGVAGLDPETHPQACYWDEAGATPASQPLDVKGGYIVNGTTPATPYTAGSYSIRVYDGLGNVVWYNADVTTLLDSSGASLVGFIQSGAGSVARTARDKLRESVSVKDFGATGDGTTDDTTGITAADAIVGRKYSPAGTYKTTLASTDLDGPYWGDGQIKTGSNKRAPWFSAIKAAPGSTGTWTSLETAFNGDVSHIQLPMEHRITGGATLGQPASGYTYTPEAYPVVGYLYNSSGWNNDTASNTGRTAACFYRTYIYQAGQGDSVAYNATAFVTGARAGATSFLANPAASLFNGDMTAGSAGVYLNPYETNCHDGGFDVAYVGNVINGDRTVDTGALGAWWGGYRAQSNGAKAWDNILSATGKFNVGLDLAMSGLDFGTNKCAVSLKADTRIYFNNASSNGNFTTSFNGWWIGYNSGLSGIEIAANNTSVLQIVAGQVTLTKPLKMAVLTVATLPTAATSQGLEAWVSDANATTRYSIVAAGGANFVKVFSNGTNWLIA